MRYDSSKAIALVGGRKITGFYGDEALKARRTNALVSVEEDHNGDAVHSMSNSKLGEVEITVSQQSPDYHYLLDLQNQMVPVWIHNNNNVAEKTGGSRAMLENTPEASHGKTSGGRTFKFLVADYEHGY